MRFSVLLSLYYKENPIFLRESLHSVFGQTLQPERMDLQEISTKIVAHSYVGRFIPNIEK